MSNCDSALVKCYENKLATAVGPPCLGVRFSKTHPFVCFSPRHEANLPIVVEESFLDD